MISQMLKKSDIWALLFGIIMVLIIFGDATANPEVGNLDTIFGQALWPAMDAIYPLASITFFLLYGKSKGPLKMNLRTVWPLIVFLVVVFLIQIDDIFVAFGHPITLSDTYFTAARWLYFIIAPSMLLLFGSACRQNN